MTGEVWGEDKQRYGQPFVWKGEQEEILSKSKQQDQNYGWGFWCAEGPHKRAATDGNPAAVKLLKTSVGEKGERSIYLPGQLPEGRKFGIRSIRKAHRSWED